MENSFKLTRVGVTGILKPVVVRRHGRDNHLVAEIDVFVDLPSTQRGSHMSRNVEVVTEMVDESVRARVGSLEQMAANICRELLKRHDYASFAEVQMRADYFLERRPQGGKTSLEPFKLIAKATARLGNGLMKSIGVEARGNLGMPRQVRALKDDAPPGRGRPDRDGRRGASMQSDSAQRPGCRNRASSHLRSVREPGLECPAPAARARRAQPGSGATPAGGAPDSPRSPPRRGHHS